VTRARSIAPALALALGAAAFALAFASGCGFVTDAADLAGADLAGADFAPADGGADAPDFADAVDLAAPPDFALASGPGPLGALPSGYCCASNLVCRSRQCINTGSGPFYCADPCAMQSACDAAMTGTFCDNPNMTCLYPTEPYTCVGEGSFHFGAKQTGMCCGSDSDCLGNWCLAPGSYCSQGCNDQSMCPLGYHCRLQGITTMHPGVCEADVPGCT
jgi:hypothetical protein